MHALTLIDDLRDGEVGSDGHERVGIRTRKPEIALQNAVCAQCRGLHRLVERVSEPMHEQFGGGLQNGHGERQIAANCQAEQTIQR